ncbi:ISAs1 family transposase [Streptomyces sp. NPDC058683]|uniref:ISAs1 family transposase n=1 Tax=Streptomyces sp. NPDC058683 TaxID=3346597 RepID=UPI0036577581
MVVETSENRARPCLPEHHRRSSPRWSNWAPKLAVAAVLTGVRSLVAISEWITDAPQQVLDVLRFSLDPFTGLRPVPHAARVRRLLQRVDGDALDAAISAYLQARAAPPSLSEGKRPVRRVIAVDGKVVRGSRTKTVTVIQLLAALDHQGVVLAQRQVASRSNEIPSFVPLLDGLDLQNTVVTSDALHTQHDHGAYPFGRGAHYVAVVKKNHPGLYAQVRKLPWRDVPPGHRTRDHAHHRDEIRRLKVAAFSHLDYPGARQAIQVVWWRRDLSTRKLTIERIHLITSLSVFDATCTELATWIRGHWGIENLPHHVRDRTFREDDSKVRTGTPPRAMASLRNLAISAFRQDGQTKRRLRPPPYRPRLTPAPTGPRPHVTNPDRSRSAMTLPAAASRRGVVVSGPPSTQDPRRSKPTGSSRVTRATNAADALTSQGPDLRLRSLPRTNWTPLDGFYDMCQVGPSGQSAWPPPAATGHRPAVAACRAVLGTGATAWTEVQAVAAEPDRCLPPGGRPGQTKIRTIPGPTTPTSCP